MIFQELNKFKRTTIMSSIILIAAGILMIVCPEEYIKAMIGLLGSVMLVFSVMGILDFLGSNKAFIHYIYLTGWLVLGIAGFIVLIFEINSMYAVGWIFGAFLVLSGLANITNAFLYVKRSGRKGWWLLVLLGAAMIACGCIAFVNPWWKSYGSFFKALGGMMLFSSVVSILRLILIWPIKSE